MLVATAAFEAAYGIAPDYIIDDDFLATGAGDVFFNDTLEWPTLIGTPATQLLPSLAAKQAVWINRISFETKVGATWTGEALLEVEETEGLKLLNLNFVNGETFFNFSCFETSTSGDVYLMTTSTSNNVSNLHIVNTSGIPQAFTGTLYNGGGTQQGSSGQALTGTIAPRGRVVLTAEDLETVFGVSPWSGPALLRVSGSYAFELMIKLESPSGLISNTNYVRQGEVHNIEGFDTQDVTYVRFINIGTTTISNITGTLFDANGDAIGAANTQLLASLAPKQAVWLTRNSLANLVGNNWNGEATLRVSDHDDLRLLNLNFINSETFFNFSCYEASE